MIDLFFAQNLHKERIDIEKHIDNKQKTSHCFLPSHGRGRRFDPCCAHQKKALIPAGFRAFFCLVPAGFRAFFCLVFCVIIYYKLPFFALNYRCFCTNFAQSCFPFVHGRNGGFSTFRASAEKSDFAQSKKKPPDNGGFLAVIRFTVLSRPMRRGRPCRRR